MNVPPLFLVLAASEQALLSLRGPNDAARTSGNLEALVGRSPGQNVNYSTSGLSGRLGLVWGSGGARQVVRLWQLLPKPADSMSCS